MCGCHCSAENVCLFDLCPGTCWKNFPQSGAANGISIVLLSFLFDEITLQYTPKKVFFCLGTLIGFINVNIKEPILVENKVIHIRGGCYVLLRYMDPALSNYWNVCDPICIHSSMNFFITNTNIYYKKNDRKIKKSKNEK